MLIAGFLYVADLENMVQYCRNEHGRRRRIKRDVVDIPKKGVAGLRLEPEPVPIPTLPAVTLAARGHASSADGVATAEESQSLSFGLMASPPTVRPPTVLGQHLTSPLCPSALTLEDYFSQLLISQPESEEVCGDDDTQTREYAFGSSESEEEKEGDQSRWHVKDITKTCQGRASQCLQGAGPPALHRASAPEVPMDSSL